MQENDPFFNMLDRAKAERKPWDTQYQEVADYMLPRRAAFTHEITKGENRHDYLYDSTAVWALEQFANGLHSMMTSPLSRWFSLQVKDRELQDNQDVRAWLDTVEEILYDQFNSAASSFHPTLQESYTDLGAFGYSVAYSEWSDDDSSVLFQARFPGECYLVEDQYGRVIGVLRDYSMDIDKFVRRFGIEKLKQSEREKYEKDGSGEKKRILHIVLPRNYPVMASVRNKIASVNEYGSVYLCKEAAEKTLSVGGFRSFPYHVARWSKRTGEVYSTSPGLTALPEARKANTINADLIRFANMQADPPSQAPDDEAIYPYDTSPGARNFYRPGQDGRIEFISANGSMEWAERVLERIQQRILQSFFVDAFLTTVDSNGQNVKATFVMQRRDERFRQLASMLSRIEREYLGTVISRTFDLCESRGLIPPPPVDVANIEVDYLSPIARAQRSESLDSLYQLVELSSLAAQYDPTVMEGINFPTIQQDVGSRIMALPARWFRTAEEVAQRVQGREQQAAEAQAIQNAQGMAGAIKDVAQANLAGRPV